jgi:hypothetical protein
MDNSFEESEYAIDLEDDGPRRSAPDRGLAMIHGAPVTLVARTGRSPGRSPGSLPHRLFGQGSFHEAFEEYSTVLRNTNRAAEAGKLEAKAKALRVTPHAGEEAFAALPIPVAWRHEISVCGLRRNPTPSGR